MLQASHAIKQKALQTTSTGTLCLKPFGIREHESNKGPTLMLHWRYLSSSFRPVSYPSSDISITRVVNISFVTHLFSLLSKFQALRALKHGKPYQTGMPSEKSSTEKEPRCSQRSPLVWTDLSSSTHYEKLTDSEHSFSLMARLLAEHVFSSLPRHKAWDTFLR